MTIYINTNTQARVKLIGKALDCTLQSEGVQMAVYCPENQPTELRVKKYSEFMNQFTEANPFTTGHCENRKRPGGCNLHNLQCGYPHCDIKYEKHI